MPQTITQTIKLGDVSVDVVQKDIKNIHLSVNPPTGKVRISAPEHMKMDTIRVFAVSKLGWIKREQQKLREQERETPREYVDRESHFVWGRRYLLKIVEADAVPRVELKHNKLVLQARAGSDARQRRDVLTEWYRQQMKEAVHPLVEKWEPVIGVRVNRNFVQRMKTKWGSCNHHAGNIRLNLELAKKPPECLEYIVVHEMVHLLEPTHNERFMKLMDRFMPNWQHYREMLNRLPVRHEEWEY